jgi:hypothetical protein
MSEQPMDDGARSAAWAAAAAATVLAALVLVEQVRLPRASVSADGRWDHYAFRGYEDYARRPRGMLLDPGEPVVTGFRVSSDAAEILVPGLGRQAPVAVSMAVAGALPKAQVLMVEQAGRLVHTQDVGGRPRLVHFQAVTDQAGSLRLRLTQAGGGGAFRVGSLTARQLGRAPVPAGRILAVAAILVLAGALAAVFGGLRALPWAVVSVGGVVLILSAVPAARTLLCGHFAPLLCSLAAAAMVALVARGPIGLPGWAAGGVALPLACRIFLALNPAFPSIDARWHAYNVDRYRAGQVIQSAVSDGRGEVMPIPYGVTLYAFLGPVTPRGDFKVIEAAVRMAMALLEGTVPLLVALILRRLGGVSGAPFGALAAATMPESLLVLAKGIAANIAGAWLGLAAVAVEAAAAPVVVMGLLACLSLLAHPGAAATTTILLAAWQAAEWRAGSRRALLGMAVVAAAVGVAWLAYYREVQSVTSGTAGLLAADAGAAPSAFFRLRWVHLGKVVQDLILKLGGLWVVLAVQGLRDAPPRLRRLLGVWLGSAAALALLALFTPVALRFEYYAAPAVAIAAGLASPGRRRLAWGAAALGLVLQAWLGLALLDGSFDPINVIIPSSRWPLVRG